jgi:predicted nucleotidyltransferase
MNKDCKKFIDEFHELHPGREIIFLIKAGSHFFDLASPTSDTDYRGIYMPSLEEFYNGESKRKFFERKTLAGNKTGVKNTKEDTDMYLFSYTFFLDLLKRGDFNCMEMLHAPDDKILINSEEMQYLSIIRKTLLVNDISAFLGFIKREYRRYGVNINHYKIQKEFADFLRPYLPHTKLEDIWSEIKEYAKDDPQIVFTTSLTGNNNRVPTLKIAQRMYQNTVKVDYVVKGIDSRLKKYGHRQKNMAKAGVEFKGLYHALRLIYEANDLYDHGELKFPFDKKRHKVLKSIKDGTAKKNYIFKLIDSEIDKLYDREKETITNRPSIEYRVNKLLFNIEGKAKIKYLTEGQDDRAKIS